jgi:hypothetical protein
MCVSSGKTPCCWKPLRVFTTTCGWKHLRGTRLIDEPNGNNVKNWAISSVTSYGRKMCMYITHRLDYGGHSETEPVLVSDDELTTQSLLQIQSSLLGNLEDIHREMK